MSTEKDFRFDFHTSSSGDFKGLLARLDMNQTEATAKALIYYALYICGVYHGGRQLVMVDPSGHEAWPLDAEPSEAHTHSDTLSVKFNEATLNHISASAYKNSVSEMLTSAFVLLETICDIRDSNYGLGLYDAQSHELVPLRAEEHSPGDSADSIDKLVLAIAPSRTFMN